MFRINIQKSLYLIELINKLFYLIFFFKLQNYKLLKINFNDSKSNSMGQTLNLISNDLKNIDDMFIYFPILLSCPIVLISSICVLAFNVDKFILSGIPLILICLLLTSLLNKYNSKLRFLF